MDLASQDHKVRVPPGVRWGIAVVLASAGAFAAILMLMEGWLVAAGALGAASLILPPVIEAFLSESPRP